MDIVGEIRGAHWNDKVARKAIKEIKQLRQQNAELVEALQCVTAYWDEWKDAPDDNEVALSLEEVVQICRETLGDK